MVEHLKNLALHCDLGPGERFFWFTTTGWMMWNFLISGLMVGATILLYGSRWWRTAINFRWLLRSGTITEEDLRLVRYVDSPSKALELLKASLRRDRTVSAFLHRPVP